MKRGVTKMKAKAAVRETMDEQVRRILVIGSLLVAVAFTMLGVSSAHGATLSGWMNNPEIAMTRAKQLGKPLVMVIAREGCEACIWYENELAKPAAYQALKKAIKVRVEANDYPDLLTKYAAAGTPTTVVFTPETDFAEPVYTHTGALRVGEVKDLGQSIGAAATAKTR